MPVFDVEANGKTFEVEASDIQAAAAAIKTHFGGTSSDAPVTASGLGKAALSGVGSGVAGLAGLPADAVDLATRGIDYLAGTKMNESIGKPAADYAGSGAMTGYLEKATGPLYKPQNAYERGAHTLGEFAPAAVAGPGGIARRVATQVLAPALASEAAGLAADGTEAAPYARAGAAILGAGGASRVARAAEARTAAAAAPAVARAELDAGTAAGYNHPEVRALQIDSAGANRLVDRVVRDLTRDRFSEKQAASTYDALRNLRTPEFGVNHTLQDFDATRRILNTIAADTGTEGAAARRAVRAIDAYTLRVPQADVAAGNARAAGQALQEGRQNAAAAFRDQRIQEIVQRAQNTAGATHSGGNLENELRKGVRNMLNSREQMRGFSGEERLALQAFARGSAAANVLRRVAKILGGGGGLGQLASSAMGSAVAGPMGMIGAPALGMAANRLGSASAMRNLQNIAGQVRLRSPVGAQLPAPAPMLPQLSARNNALLSAALSQPLQLQPFQNYAGR